MKKVIILVVLLLVIGAGGFLYYELNIKEIDVQDTAVNQITDEEYDIVLPDEVPEDATSTKDTDEQASTATDSMDTENTSVTNNDEKVAANTEDKNTNTNTKQSKASKDNKLSVSEIKARYRPVFEQLEDQANTRIDSLLLHAFDEYKQKKKEDESISFTYFYSKYKGAADDLEAKTDTAFNTIYDSLKKELVKNGYESVEAKEFKNSYEDAKSKRRKAIITKALDVL